MDKQSRIFVAGHLGLVGSAITRNLTAAGYSNLILRTRAELDLTNQAAVDRFFSAERPEYVFLAAALVGGIMANDHFPADFIRENLLIQTLAIDSAYRNKVTKLQFLGSSCVYPKLAPQPIHEDALLTSPLEPTERSLWGGENRGPENGAGLPPAIRFSRNLPDADQSLRAG